MKIKKKSVDSRKNNIKVKVNKNVFFSFLFFISFIIFLISFMFELPSSAILLGISLIILSTYCLFDGIRKIKSKNFFNVDISVCAAAFALFCFGGFQQSVCCMFIYSIGKLITGSSFESNVSTLETIELINNKKYHCVADRETFIISANEIKPGDFIELFSGEDVPVDGRVKAGSGTISTVNVTGDSKIESKYSGDYLMAGYTLLSGNLIIEAESDVEGSVFSRNCNEVKDAFSQKTTAEKILNTVTGVLSIITIFAIIITSVIKLIQSKDYKSLMFFLPAGILFSQYEFMRGVISNAYRVGIYRFLKKGIVIRKKGFVEKNLFTQNIGFTVNGVLTSASSEILNVYTELDITKDELLKFAAYSQYKNDTEVSKAILKSADLRIKLSDISEYKRYPGNGSSIKLFGNIDVITGTAELLKSFNIVSGIENDSTKLCVAINGNYVGYIEFQNEIKQDLRQCMDSLRFAGVKKINIISDGSVKTVSEIVKRASLGKADNSIGYNAFFKMYNDLKQKAILICTDEYIDDNEYISCLSYNTKMSIKAQAYTLVDNLTAPVNFLNIIKDVKMLMLQNFLIYIAYIATFVSMLISGVPSLWLCFILVLLSELLIKMNEIRVLKKKL